MRYAAIVFYDGTQYKGFQKQPGLRTIENELNVALRKTGASPIISYTGRTDAGVSAMYQVITFDSDKNPRNVNSYLPRDITVWGLAVVDKMFDPRRDAIYRVYRYFSPSLAENPRTKEILSLFNGKHEFASFCKKCKSFITTLSVKLLPCGIFEFKAKSFRWHMIRKIITAISFAISGKISVEDISQALDGKKVLSLPPAPPEPLVLWHVEVPVKFEILGFAIKRINSYLLSLIQPIEGRLFMARNIIDEISKSKGIKNH